jgi:hypothetical protein
MSDFAIPQASLFLGIIPALILLYISLKGYEGYFKDKIIFLTFVAGIVAGFISVIIETYASNIGILFIVLFPIIEQLFKTIILNIGRFQKKKETTIYGLSLGLGFGSIFTPFSMITSNIQTSDLYLIVVVIIGSIGIILLHGATGVCIGYGVYSGKLQKYFLLSIILHLPLTSLIFLTTLLKIEYLQIGLTIYGLIVYWYITKNIMPKILLQQKSRKRGNIKTNS